MINRVAIDLIENAEGKKFFKANEAEVIKFASTPDVRWKDGKTGELEKPLHWFEIDGYGTTDLGSGVADMVFGRAQSALGRETVNKYGMALWRSSDLFEDLVRCIKKRDWTRALQVGGVLGHYVGDMTQPMHTTTDYDGQSINQPGVHKYYETTLIDKLNQEHLFNFVLASAGNRRTEIDRTVSNELSSLEFQHFAYQEAEAGNHAMEQILPQFDGGYNNSWLQEDLKPRLARASALVAKLWDVAFLEAGDATPPSQNLSVKEPEWIPFKMN